MQKYLLYMYVFNFINIKEKNLLDWTHLELICWNDKI